MPQQLLRLLLLRHVLEHSEQSHGPAVPALALPGGTHPLARPRGGHELGLKLVGPANLDGLGNAFGNVLPCSIGIEGERFIQRAGLSNGYLVDPRHFVRPSDGLRCHVQFPSSDLTDALDLLQKTVLLPKFARLLREGLR